MSQHAEFVDVTRAHAVHLDGYHNAETPVTNPVLVIDSGAADIVFYGEHAEIIDLLNTAITAMVRKPIPEDSA